MKISNVYFYMLKFIKFVNKNNWNVSTTIALFTNVTVLLSRKNVLCYKRETILQMFNKLLQFMVLCFPYLLGSLNQ